MSAEMSLVWLTISKPLEMPIAMVDVRSGRQGWLKSWAILCTMGRMEDTVEWLGRKSCWLRERGIKLTSCCRRRSKTIAAGQRKEKYYVKFPTNFIFFSLIIEFYIALFINMSKKYEFIP